MSPADALAVTSCRTCVTAGVRKTLVGSGSSHHLEWSQPGLESARRGLARTSSGGSQSRIYTSNLYSVNPWGGGSTPSRQPACLVLSSHGGGALEEPVSPRTAGAQPRTGSDPSLGTPALAGIALAPPRGSRRAEQQRDKGKIFKHGTRAMPGPRQSERASQPPALETPLGQRSMERACWLLAAAGQ